MDERRVGGEEVGDKKKGWTNMHGGRGGGMVAGRERQERTEHTRSKEGKRQREEGGR